MSDSEFDSDSMFESPVNSPVNERVDSPVNLPVDAPVELNIETSTRTSPRKPRRSFPSGTSAESDSESDEVSIAESFGESESDYDGGSNDSDDAESDDDSLTNGLLENIIRTNKKMPEFQVNMHGIKHTLQIKQITRKGIYSNCIEKSRKRDGHGKIVKCPGSALINADRRLLRKWLRNLHFRNLLSTNMVPTEIKRSFSSLVAHQYPIHTSRPI